MMIKQVPDGVWPTMVTPYKPDGSIDYKGLAELVEWYISQDVAGLFAVCQSSEMFFLSLAEKLELTRFICGQAAGRVPVIASGHTSPGKEDQLYELEAMAETGLDALVLISSRLAAEDEPDSALQGWTEKIMARISDVTLGVYECPHPYKRVLSPELVGWLARTGRFKFLKDTCRDPGLIRAKVQAGAPHGMKVFNANAASLLETLQGGAAGYSGVMANFHPDLYVWLQKNWSGQPEKAAGLQDYLSLASAIEYQYYPVNAKYHLQLCQVPIGLGSRSRDPAAFDISHQLETRALFNLSQKVRQELLGQ